MNVDLVSGEPARLRQWVVWVAEVRDGKPCKVPYIAGEKRTFRASSTARDTWRSFPEACGSLDWADGVGFVFSPDDGLCGIDLDGCVTDGELHPRAQAIVDRFASYTELSPSGRGVHIIVRAKLAGRNRRGGMPWGGGIEIYDRGRYFTVTGERLGDIAEISAGQTQLDELTGSIFPPPSNGGPSPMVAPLDVADEDLIEKAIGAGNGREFEALWSGDTGGYASRSEADLALAGRLAFWTGGDGDRIARMLKRSGLYREKLDRADYMERTIARALAGRTEFYSPGNGDRRSAQPDVGHDPTSGAGANGGGNEVVSAKVDAISRALFEDPQKTGDMTGPPRQELAGSGGLCHRDHAALFFSERGAGKSTVALMVGVSVAVAGGTVYYFDRENGAALTMARVEGILDAQDWPDVIAEGRFIGRHYPLLDKSWKPELFGEAIASRGLDLVIYDSLREAISQLGGDPNSDADISRFIDLAVTPLVRRGISVVVLDNTGHEHKNRPKGSGTKLDAIPQAYKVVATEPFSPVVTGRVSVTCTRSRLGDIGRDWTMRVGGGVFELPEARDEAPDVKAARERHEKREAFRRACVAALQERRPLGRDPLIKASRDLGGKGTDAKLRDWLAELAADPASGITSGSEGYDLDTVDPPGRSDSAQGPPTPARGPLGDLGAPYKGAQGPAPLGGDADEEHDRLARKFGHGGEFDDSEFGPQGTFDEGGDTA